MQVATTFAKSISIKATAFRTLNLTKDEQREIKNAISFDIRLYGNLKKPKVSRKAQIKANELGIPISDMRWSNQNKYDKGRCIFHLEHFDTVKDIRDACIKTEKETEIVSLLVGSIIVWILKAEDKLLTDNGQRSSRSDPTQAYLDAGIEILDCK